MRDVFWIGPSHQSPSVGLAIVLRPRGDDWLEDEVRRIKQSGVTTLVSMLEDCEARSLGLAGEATVARQNGLQFLSHPIEDRGLPLDLEGFRGFTKNLADRLISGEQIGVHCRGSIGRSTLAAAATLIHLGWSQEEALRSIESARGCIVPDTDEQREWILNFKANA